MVIGVWKLVMAVILEEAFAEIGISYTGIDKSRVYRTIR
jgi:hypothetical protein